MVRDVRNALSYSSAVSPIGVIAKATADLGRNSAAQSETPIQKLIEACKALAIRTTTGPPLPAAGLGSGDLEALVAKTSVLPAAACAFPKTKIIPIDAAFFSSKARKSPSIARTLAEEYKDCEKSEFEKFFAFVKKHKSVDVAIKKAAELIRGGCGYENFAKFWTHCRVRAVVSAGPTLEL